MCGRFSDTIDREKFSEEFGLPPARVPERRPRYHVAPGQPVTVLLKEKQVKLETMLWGLVPFWARDPNGGYKMIHVRVETILEKVTYKGLFRGSRCLIPSDGFYGWKKEGQTKRPYHIRLKGGAPYSFAGIWAHWISKDGSELLSCQEVACEAGPPAPIRGHDPGS